jgi:diaminohydroxyphosphoribosylaminopyrimidine deaminase / 5-amino-6-(5-phosphoribosylamino)uracil reductase
MGSGDDLRWMRLAIELAWLAPQSVAAYSVGAVIVGADGAEVSRGFSREGGDSRAHAEEAALGKLGPGDPRLAGATIYSTLEPCSQRKSRPRSCTELILATRAAAPGRLARSGGRGGSDGPGRSGGPGGNIGFRRVVIAWREPGLFVADCQGVELLAQAGIEITELPQLAELAKAPNRHLAV